jgi:chitodextrinase
LTATLVKGKRLQLSWKPSTDNVAVAGYLIYRNGTQIGTVATTAFSDTVGGRRSSTSYWVIAFDSSRNLSPPTDPIVVSP